MKTIFRLVEKSLLWLPYASVSLLIFFDVRLHGVLSRMNSAADLYRGEGGLLICELLATIGMMLLQLTLCCRKQQRKIAIFSLSLATFLIVSLLACVETILPPVVRFSDLQRSLQSQLNRRLEKKEILFCGTKTHLDANYLGWIDNEHRYESAAHRVVLIGDSFLETLTTKPLARRIEEHTTRAGCPIEVINLSKDDTEPETQYRHWLFELTFGYHPDQILMFIYSGNDLGINFKYFPYMHPPFRVTEQAVRFLAQANVKQRLLTSYQSLQQAGQILHSRSEFMDSMARIPIDREQLDLAYLAAVAYSHGHGPSYSEIYLPNTVARFENLRAKASESMKSVKLPNFGAERACACVPLDDIKSEYQAIFMRPREQRLREIARFIAHSYCQRSDDEPFFRILNEQDPWFIEQIIEYPDAMGSLMNTVVRAANGENTKKRVKMNRVEAAADEYVKLFLEFREAARQRNVGFTLVFIPVATNIDDQFNRGWERMRNVGKGDGRGPPMVAALTKRLTGRVDFVDLSAYSVEFQGGYWLFDGHWNEKGNEAAAKILAEYLLANGNVPLIQ